MSGAAEPVILSWSGGKDSALALDHLRRDGRHEPVALLTSVTLGYDRVSIHGVRRPLLQAQARAIGLPLHELHLQPQSSNDAYEAAFAGALDRLEAAYPDVRTLVFGDLFLEDVRAYRERLLAPRNWHAHFPLWGMSTSDLATAFVREGYMARLVCVDTTQLDTSFTGRVFDASLLADLPPGVDRCGERGEFHTFVSAAPSWADAIPYDVGEVVLRDDRFAYCDLLPPSSSAS